MKDKAGLAAWIQKKVDLAPLVVEIRHRNDSKVDTVEHGAGETSLELVERIFELCADDALGHDTDGPQTYWLCLRRPGETTIEARKPITVDLNGDDRIRGNDYPDERGIVSQTMRHQEATMRTGLGYVRQSTDAIMRMNETLMAQQIEYQRTEAERLMLQRRLTQELADRQLEKERLAVDQARDAWIMRQLELILPVGMSKLLGDGNAKGAEEGKILLEFAKTLKPEQMDAVAAVLDPPMRMLLAELAQGGIETRFQGLAVQRLMDAIQPEQYAAILQILDTPNQRHAFTKLFEQRKKGLAWAERQASEQRLAELPPGSPVPQLSNGKAEQS